MASVHDYQTVLRNALQIANSQLASQELSVYVTGNTGPKAPVFLTLKYPNGTIQKIGIIHLVHLSGENWDDQPYENLARKVEEVSQSILTRISLFTEALEKNKYFISQEGALFDFSEFNLVEPPAESKESGTSTEGKMTFAIHKNGTFSLNGKTIKWQGDPLSFRSIQSEGIIKPVVLDTGHIRLDDGIDRRVGKGIFIDLEGNVYRK